MLNVRQKRVSPWMLFILLTGPEAEPAASWEASSGELSDELYFELVSLTSLIVIVPLNWGVYPSLNTLHKPLLRTHQC